AAVVPAEPLGLELEHAQGVVEQLGVLVFDGGVVEGPSALEEPGSAGGLAQRQGAGRGPPVGARQLEQADGLVVVAMRLEQLGGFLSPALAGVQLGPLPWIATELGGEAGLQNHGRPRSPEASPVCDRLMGLQYRTSCTCAKAPLRC